MTYRPARAGRHASVSIRGLEHPVPELLQDRRHDLSDAVLVFTNEDRFSSSFGKECGR